MRCHIINDALARARRIPFTKTTRTQMMKKWRGSGLKNEEEMEGMEEVWMDGWQD